MSGLKKGCLTLVLIVVLVVVGGWVYFTINPPFALPETGYLSATANDELSPFEDPHAYRLRIEPSSEIYEGSSTSAFPPARITASVVGAGGPDSTTVEVLAASDAAIPLIATDTPGSAEWELDCKSGETSPCVGDYVLVINSNTTSREADSTLEIFVEQEFPAHVPTPFLTGIDVNLDPIDLPSSRPFETDAASHTVMLEPDAPVELFDLEVVSPSDAVVEGGTLTVNVERLDPTIAVGSDAPPPVRVALVNDTNRVVVADIGARPGTETRVALPPLAGNYRVAAWWQDYADQRYDVTWELEVGSVSETGRPAIDVTQRPAPVASETITSSGESIVGPADSTVIPIGMEPQPGTPAEVARLPPVIGVFRTRFELTDDASDTPLLLLIGQTYVPSDGSRIPVVLRVGEPVEVAIDARLGCIGNRCEAWSGTVTDPADPDSPDPSRAARLQWESTLVIWPLGDED